ncbi:glucosamine fructose 6 phosphate aminotransferase [Babesia gibsoni]|uniref:glutamine--fructose-6-phosphate transaminase (isomerizing) n=1 Tax=Babesia gibsoni TaxID=33632 RepID=A0AAD8PEY0_BABGI|nr:glucosamine fructose 6 phosphate aminotransferase [Babesia gibsoni]
MHFFSDIRRLFDSSFNGRSNFHKTSSFRSRLTDAILKRVSFPSVFSRTANCCGVVAYVGNEECREILLHGVQSIMHRGYDSCGIGTLAADGSIEVTKCCSYKVPANCFERLRDRLGSRHQGSKIGIAHTRWATIGTLTDENAHPHCDLKNRLALVHNGTVTNTVEVFNEMCDTLIKKGLEPSKLYNTKFECPDSDSGAIAYLIGLQLDLGYDIFTSLKNVVSRLEGSWAICLVTENNPKSLFVARQGCPVLVIKDELTRSVILASEAVAFWDRAEHFVVLDDGDIMELNYETVEELYKDRPVVPITKQVIQITPEPYDYWIQKEVVEQKLVYRVALQHLKLLKPSSDLKALKIYLEGLMDVTFDSGSEVVEKELKLLSAVDPCDIKFEIPGHGDKSLLNKAIANRNIHVIAAGSSGHAARYAVSLFQKYDCFNMIETDDPTELAEYRYLRPDSTFIYVSQSGETLDTVWACNHLIKANPNAFKIAMVNNLNTLLGRTCDMTMMLNIGREVSLASTKSFMVQLMLVTILLGYILEAQDTEGKHTEFLTEIKRSVLKFSHCIQEMMQYDEQYERIARVLADTPYLYTIGSCEGYAVAREGALKLKEVSYRFAEGFRAGAMKHGSLATISHRRKTPVICIVPEEDQEMTLNAARQLKARGAYIILMASDPSVSENLADEFIKLPKCGVFTAACATIPIQIMAYKIAIIKGMNPDTPRGLAKTVTVT